MILSEATHIPRDGLGPLARLGLELDPLAFGRLERDSERMWLAEDGAPCLCAGVMRPSLLVPPFFWLITYQGFAPRHLRECRDYNQRLSALYPMLRTTVLDSPQAQRFAEFFGWERGDEIFPVSAHTYRIYTRTCL